MIPVKKILFLIRVKQKDHNKIIFSDYDIMEALNECIRYVNQIYAMKNSDFLEKIYKYREDEINEEIAECNTSLKEEEEPKSLISFSATGVDLPDDFITLVSVIRASDEYVLYPIDNAKTVTSDTYKILGGKLFTGNKAINMLYRRMIPSVSIDSDNVDLPVIFQDVLIKVTGLILNNVENDVLMQAINDNANAVIPSRKYSNIKRKMPF